MTNWGTIVGTGPAGTGVLLPNGGAVTNLSSGSISGYVGVDIAGGVGTVTNAGTITNSGYGAAAVAIAGGGTVPNSGRIPLRPRWI